MGDFLLSIIGLLLFLLVVMLLCGLGLAGAQMIVQLYNEFRKEWNRAKS